MMDKPNVLLISIFLNTIFTKETITHITSIEGEIRGTISIGHQSENVHITPQTIDIECYYHILPLTPTDMKHILQHPEPILSIVNGSLTQSNMPIY